MKKNTRRTPRNDLFGLMFRPIATRDNHAEIAQSSDMSVTAGFRKAYEKHIAGMQIVGMCAKVYITENWKKITDWSGLNIVITSRKHGAVEYFNYVPRERMKLTEKSDVMSRMLERIDKDDQARHNPITSLTDLVMDEEFDFSVTINGKEHWWLNDEEVVIMADYIEKQLKIDDKAGSENRNESAPGGQG